MKYFASTCMTFYNITSGRFTHLFSSVATIKIFSFSGNGVPDRIWVWQNLPYSCHVVISRHDEAYITSRNWHCARAALFCYANIAPEFYLYLQTKYDMVLAGLLFTGRIYTGEFMTTVERGLIRLTFCVNGKIDPVEFASKETEEDSFGWVPLCHFNDFYFAQNVSARKCSRKHRISFSTGNVKIPPIHRWFLRRFDLAEYRNNTTGKIDPLRCSFYLLK